MGTWGAFLSYGGDGHSKLVFVQLHQDFCLVTTDSSGISSRPGRAIWTLLEVRRETEGPFLDHNDHNATVILAFLSIFEKTQASSPFEAMNSACLSSCERNMRPPVQVRRGPESFYRVCTGDSDIPSSCEMKDEPAFKSLQGHPACFPVRASRCPFHLR